MALRGHEIIAINSHSDRQCTHTHTQLIDYVFMDLVKIHLVRTFHSELSSQQLCHSWQTTRLQGQRVSGELTTFSN